MIQKADKHCSNCSCGEGLQVHHLVYIRGVEPWDYDERFLKVLCSDCHYNWQINQEQMQVALALMCGQRGLWHAYNLSKTFLDLAELEDRPDVAKAIENLITKGMAK